MRQLFLTSVILIMMGTNTVTAQDLSLSFLKVKQYEQQLDDVMEIIDTTVLKHKLREVEEAYHDKPDEVNSARLGIIYHETALNLTFLSKSPFSGYARKSFNLLSSLADSPDTTKELLPFILSYRASALALAGAETKKFWLLGEAFSLFADAVNDYANISYLPEFLRGSVAENLPWIFFFKKRAANDDFQSIVDKYSINPRYANAKVMSFTYWALAKQKQAQREKSESFQYLEKAIMLDPHYEAGRARAEELKASLLKQEADKK